MTTIHITGPGGCIGNEIVLIEQILKDHGYLVENRDSHPDPTRTFEIVSAHVKKYNAGGYNKPDFECGPMAVVITTTHVPWGG